MVVTQFAGGGVSFTVPGVLLLLGFGGWGRLLFLCFPCVPLVLQPALAGAVVIDPRVDLLLLEFVLCWSGMLGGAEEEEWSA